MGRVLFSAATLYMGFQVIAGGHEFYSPYWHAVRKTLMPDSKNKIDGIGLTFDEVNRYLTMAMGSLLMLGGLLTLLNQRVRGPLLVILAVLMMVVT